MLNFSYLKDIIEEKKFTINSISQKISMTSQGLSAALKNETLKVRDLEKIAEILKIDVCEFFGEKKNPHYSQVHSGIGDNRMGLSECEKEVSHLRELLAEKERLIQVLLNKL